MNKKKSLRVLVLALAVIMVFGVASTAFAATTDQIKNLQANMNYFYVGDATNAMLTVDGALGVRTQQAYQKVGTSNVDTAVSMFKTDVTTVQNKLNSNSYVTSNMGGKITVDGLAGSSSNTSTRRATAFFQESKGQANDGICGKSTRFAMFNSHSALWSIAENNKMAG